MIRITRGKRVYRMDNQPIIIDGVNVAECVCYQKEVHTSTEIFYNHCLETNKCCGTKDNYNCYFKQLQRAKAELEQLHKKYYHILNLAKQNADSSEYCMQELEAENEKLKNRNKLYKKIIVENQQKYHNQIMVLKACIQGDINTDDFKNYTKFQQENKRLKKQLKGE